MQDFYNVIANLGFPIGISCYLLWRMEKRLEGLEKVIQQLSNLIEDNTKIVEGCKGRRK